MDRLSSVRRSNLMQRVKGKNTAPEMAVRSMLHKLGYRFRLHSTKLPGTPDIVLPKHRCVIYVHGCFWHNHQCSIGRLPRSKLDYWGPKLAANRARDARKVAEARALGWTPITVWQCELREPDVLAWKLIAAIETAK